MAHSGCGLWCGDNTVVSAEGRGVCLVDILSDVGGTLSPKRTWQYTQIRTVA
jgi:hypothetical protein